MKTIALVCGSWFTTHWVHMRRALTASLLVVAFVAAASVAEAHVATGKYAGRIANKANCGPPAFTSACPKGRISLKVRAAGGTRYVTRIAWSGLHLVCEDDGDGNPEDDQVFSNAVALHPAPGRAKNTFIAEGSNEDGSALHRVKGKFRHTSSGKHRLTGTIRETQTYDTQDRLDPNGTVECDSGTARYTATLR